MLPQEMLDRYDGSNGLSKEERAELCLDLGFSEAGHLCLQVPECYAVVESDFTRNLLPQKRYVLRGDGALVIRAERLLQLLELFEV